MSEIFRELLRMLPGQAMDVAVALIPLVAVFTIYQIAILKLPKSQLIRMYMGIVYAFFGLLLFFLGVNIGFNDTGRYLGEQLAQLSNLAILIPIGIIVGFAVVMAEPAVRSLINQIMDVTGGMIHPMAIYVSMCIGVGISVGLAMIRLIWGLSLWYFLIPGYAIALILVKFSPPLFTAIAFDSGGVATGPMTSTFILSFAVGIASILGQNPVEDSFGVVALVAMTPLITLQILGLIYQYKSRQAEKLLQSLDNEDEDDLLLDELDDLEAVLEMDEMEGDVS